MLPLHVLSISERAKTKMEQNKVLCFEYIVSLLIKWHQEVTGEATGYLYSFSRLKVLKLLFFVSAVKTVDGNDLLDLFDNFSAMPLGPVECDIYKSMVDKETVVYEFPERLMKVEQRNINTIFSGIDKKTKENIENSVSALRLKNKYIVCLKPFDLVNISHQWSCWDTAYECALFFGKRSYNMSVESIRESLKYYS